MIDFILHIDQHLQQIILNYGTWTYLVLFMIIFLETGFVVTPFLPGDSLLFGAGALAAIGALNEWWLILVLGFAAILGDSVNYGIGHLMNQRASKMNNRLIKQKYLLQTQKFYERHGGKTIILARFIPIIRTFAPFVAGIAKMSYKRFVFFNVLGGLLWITFFVHAGFLFGMMPVIKNNFSVTIFAVIMISLLPALVEYLRQRFSKRPLDEVGTP